MVSEISNNKFGKNTYRIKVEPLFHIFMHETNTNIFSVEIKEWILISYKIRKSFISKSDLKVTVCDSFIELQNYLNSTSNYYWSDEQVKNKLSRTLDLFSSILTRIAMESMLNDYDEDLDN